MDELLAQVTTILKGTWKHRWIGMLAAWIVAIVAAAVVLRVPDKYEASARIFVDTQSILKPLMSGLAVQPNVDQQISMLSRTLISRPNVEKVIRMADMDLGNQSKAQQDALVDRLVGTLEIKGTGRDNLYTLSFRDPVPDKAKKVVQSLVSIFVESSLGDTRKDTDSAKKFINDQIKAYEAKLEAGEQRLKEFKLRNIETQTAAGPDAAARVGELQGLYNQAKLELVEAERARDAARIQVEAEKKQFASSLASGTAQESAAALATPEIDARIEAQKRNLDSLLQRFTEQHPDIIGARRVIKELEEQKRKEVAELRKIALATPEKAISRSPAGQELNRMLAAAEIQVASLQARTAEYGARYARARELVKIAPQTESEFSQLNRDYAINKKNYEDLVARRESASLSGELDSAAAIADFRLIDPPRVSPQPVAPNRLLLLLGALIVAIAAGGFAAFAVSQLRPVFHDARSLRSVAGLPLLGVVTLVVSDVQKRKQRSDLLRFALASGSLVACFAVGIGVLATISSRMG